MILLCGVSCCAKAEHCTNASSGVTGVILESLVRRGLLPIKLIPAFKFGSAITYLANHYGKSVCLPPKTDDLFILCDSLHWMLPQMTSSIWNHSEFSWKHSFGERVNIAQICSDSTVQHLYFPESSKKATSDVFCESWEAHFHCHVVQGQWSW